MATTDLHAQVWPFDYETGRSLHRQGLAHLATLIDHLKREATNSLLLDNGDFLQGTVLADAAAEAGTMHPVIAAMNAIGYDAGTVGNHDFNYGLPLLDRAIKQAHFPLVCANVTTVGTGQNYFRPYTILDRDLPCGDGRERPIRIGVVGGTPPEIMDWDRLHLQGKVTSSDISDAITSNVRLLRAEGADIVVALCHAGIEPGPLGRSANNSALQLATMHGVDAIIAGHTHSLFPQENQTSDDSTINHADGTLHGIPTIMPAAHGREIGVIDLQLVHSNAGWKVAGHTSQRRPIPPRSRPNRYVLRATRGAHHAARAYIEEPLGITETALHLHFARIQDAPALRLIADSQFGFVRCHATQVLEPDIPLLCAVAPHQARAVPNGGHVTDIPIGTVRHRHLIDLLPYPNTLCVLELTGQHIRDWLNRVARAFQHVPSSAQDAPLLNPVEPAYNFDVLFGLTYRFDLSQPVPAIDRLQLAGRDVQTLDRFHVITTNHRAGGGSGFSVLRDAVPVWTSSRTTRDVLRDYILLNPKIDPPTLATWSFKPMHGTTAKVTCEVGAGHHLTQLKHPALEPLGERPGNLIDLRLHL
ncbi:5'-nucleotidase C-terminal domain-containing protein [Qingshengfaniella alkalisoli]|uniref:2',3'-cyclic-nucleotide 2'-phosphodiesterase/3'-nucleotidase n=1 Tax=Qingshengfaniella alkalisoli TaxID=2599296 RepID=A0A5B8ISP3_9RHOB|nr:5'-nucleotidase C-terminal domain-containing protein [Qingshengfaniella alkalisoli]QDY68624.1 hypothetical protein FPZ52_02650 [Qingshengfaniella alkalisoli]